MCVDMAIARYKHLIKHKSLADRNIADKAVVGLFLDIFNDTDMLLEWTEGPYKEEC